MNLTRRAAAAALVSTPFVSTVDARAEARISRESGRANRWRTEMFDAAARQQAGPRGYVIIRDTTCRLFGYHGLMNPGHAFSLDHMFGF